MRIVNLQTFLSLPAGTLFCKYKLMDFGPIEIFCGPSYEGSTDFVAHGIQEVDSEGSSDMLDILIKAQDSGCSFKLDFEATSRDGECNTSQRFAVWDKDDVVGLLNLLTTGAVAEAYQLNQKLTEILHFEDGLTVPQLKALVKDLPEVDDNGEPYEVWMGTDEGTSNVVTRVARLNEGDLIFDTAFTV